MFEVEDEHEEAWIDINDVSPRQPSSVTGTTFDRTVTRPAQGVRPEPMDMSVLNTAKEMIPNPQGAPLELRISREDATFCKVCKVSLSGEEPAKQHYAGKAHRKALQRMSLEGGGHQGGQGSDNFHCSICDVNFTGAASAKQHYEGKSHKKAEAITKRKEPQQGGVAKSSSVETKPFSLFSGQGVLSGGSGLPTTRGLDTTGRLNYFASNGFSIGRGSPAKSRQAPSYVEADSTLPDSTTAIPDKMPFGEGTFGKARSQPRSIGADIAEHALLKGDAAEVCSGLSGQIGSDTLAIKNLSPPPSSLLDGGNPNPDIDSCRQEIVAACSKVMMSMIPEIANKVADMLLNSQNPSIVRGMVSSGSSSEPGGDTNSLPSRNEEPSCTSSQSSLIAFDHVERNSSDGSVTVALASTQDVFTTTGSSSSHSAAGPLVSMQSLSKPPGLWPDSSSRPISSVGREDETKVDNLSGGLDAATLNEIYDSMWKSLTKQNAK
ncbi:uncharacterized protein [Diadema antillarum]|uniref:uncharacterized protein n=1 Tax=Diadema antillarum TaxID=105358 RepID=UPI003A85F5E6